MARLHGGDTEKLKTPQRGSMSAYGDVTTANQPISLDWIGTQSQRQVSRKSERFNSVGHKPSDFPLAPFLDLLFLLTIVFATAEPRPATAPFTHREAALNALRYRFPNQVVSGV